MAEINKKSLTGREIEICVLLKEGIDIHEISGRLRISLFTVRTHLRNIHKKMEVHTRAQLVARLINLDTSDSKKERDS